VQAVSRPHDEDISDRRAKKVGHQRRQTRKKKSKAFRMNGRADRRRWTKSLEDRPQAGRHQADRRTSGRPLGRRLSILGLGQLEAGREASGISTDGVDDIRMKTSGSEKLTAKREPKTNRRMTSDEDGGA